MPIDDQGRLTCSCGGRVRWSARYWRWVHINRENDHIVRVLHTDLPLVEQKQIRALADAEIEAAEAKDLNVN